MKGSISFADFKAKRKPEPVEDTWLPDLHCCVCAKKVEGYYSRHGDVGTCSKACMTVKDLEPKYPGHTEEDFLARLK